MKIDPNSQVRASGVKRKDKSKTSGGESFAKALEGDEKTTAASGAAPVAAVDALLSLQEVPDSLSGEAQAKQRGEDLLDQLDQIRLGLLEGALAPVQVERLVGLVASKRGQISDPKLLAILDEIEIRAAVELAKLGR
ncbi:flagellar assembly protein FliX [Rhodovibrionaceae bacterium A322]